MRYGFKNITIILTIIIIFSSIIAYWFYFSSLSPHIESIGMAVEFNNHAASAYIAMSMNLYRENGINITSFNSYSTGVSLAAALARDDVQVAYICLGPALVAYSSGLPIKIVSGTHLYGYSLVVNSHIHNFKDLSGKLIGSPKEGSNADLLLHLLSDTNNLNINFDKDVRRANPSKLIMLLQAGIIDAAFLPEHHATVAESLGFSTLISSQDIWPQMLGSVLVVKNDLIENHPEIIKKLVEINYVSTEFINNNNESANIVCNELQKNIPNDVNFEEFQSQYDLITPEILERSMAKLYYNCSISVSQVEKYIELMQDLGYIQNSINPEEILDLRFLP